MWPIDAVPMSSHSKLLLLAAALAVAGCGGARSTAGGTKGHLQIGSGGMPDMQVTVYEVDSGGWKTVGFGVTGVDGSFYLFQNGARGPLILAPGDYRCTLESAGAPVKIPPEYSKPETTPLKASIKSADAPLELQAPAFTFQ